MSFRHLGPEDAPAEREAGRRGALGRGRQGALLAEGSAAPGVEGSARLCRWESPPTPFWVNMREVSRSLRAPGRRRRLVGPADSDSSPLAECTNAPWAAVAGGSCRANRGWGLLTLAAGGLAGPKVGPKGKGRARAFLSSAFPASCGFFVGFLAWYKIFQGPRRTFLRAAERCCV